MVITNMSKKKFESLEPLKLDSSILNTEAKLYLLPTKNKWNSKTLLLKRFFNTTGSLFSNKLYTINELIESSKEIGIEELVFPESIAVVNKEVVGFTMPYIPNINLKTILDSDYYTIQEKANYLKEIGLLLENMKKSRMYSNVHDFYLNDIHENNFILNTITGKINAVDLDSAKIGQNLTFGARYLSPLSNIKNVIKYELLTKSAGGTFAINDDTELFCYIIMILNLFYGANITKLSISEYYIYLDYLKNIGISQELIDKLSYIYINHPNENIVDYLDELCTLYPRTHHNVYERVRKIK